MSRISIPALRERNVGGEDGCVLLEAAERDALVEAVEAAHEYVSDNWVPTADGREQAARLRAAFRRFDFGEET